MKPFDLKLHLIPLIAYWLARTLSATLRVRMVGEEHLQTAQAAGKGVILVSWHGRTFLPITKFRDKGYWSIVSTSRDGEYQNRLFQRFGIHTVRGSTSARGAVQAALTLTKHLKAGATAAFTPDGPRGPSHVVQPGAIFLAQKSGSPIIPAGISASPRKLMRAWDQYMIPWPFARVVWIYGEPIHIPADAKGEEEQRLWAERVGAAITALEEQAEREVGAVSADGTTRTGWGLWRRA